MAKLIYSTIASLDGYVEDAEGAFGWSIDGWSHADAGILAAGARCSAGPITR